MCSDEHNNTTHGPDDQGAVEAKRIARKASEVQDNASRSALVDSLCRGDAALKSRVILLLETNNARTITPDFESETVVAGKEGSVTESDNSDSSSSAAVHGYALGQQTSMQGVDDNISTYSRSSEDSESHTGEDDLLGTYIGPYHLIELLGEGGFGSVYLAEQRKPIARRVAVKVIKLGMDSRQVLARFDAERQALAVLDHAAIAKVLDGGCTPSGRSYFVMEYVAGRPITEYCDRKRLSLSQRLELMIDVCEAVQHAHTKGIIHRDIKPGNVLAHDIDSGSSVKVIDFGIAKATTAHLTDRSIQTQQQQMMGTPRYMSPEQAAGEADIDTRTDVYSLGVVLFELLTGTTPLGDALSGHSSSAAMQQIIRDFVPQAPSNLLSKIHAKEAVVVRRRERNLDSLISSIRGELDWIVMKCLEQERERRYISPGAIAEDLRCYLRGDAVIAAPPDRVYRTKKFIQRHRIGVSAAAVVSFAVIGGLAAAGWGWRSASISMHAAMNAKSAAMIDRQNAMDQAARANAALNFMSDLFESLDPNVAEGSQVTVAQLLGPASERIQSELASKPLSESEVRGIIGKAYAHIGDNKQAIVHLKRAADLREQHLGSEDQESLTLRYNHAASVLASGDYVAARDLFDSNYKKRAILLGEDAPDTLATRGSLAYVHQLLGEMEKALAEQREVVAIQERILGKDHKDVVESMIGLADLLSSMGSFDESADIAADAAARATRLLGTESGLTISALSMQGQALRNAGKTDEAVKIVEPLVAKKEVFYGPANSSTLVTMDVLAGLYEDQHKDSLVIPMRRTVLERARTALGNNHPMTLSYTNNLAQSLRYNKQYAEAKPLYEAVLEAHKVNNSSDGRSALITQSNLGLLLIEMGEPEKQCHY